MGQKFCFLEATAERYQKNSKTQLVHHQGNVFNIDDVSEFLGKGRVMSGGLEEKWEKDSEK